MAKAHHRVFALIMAILFLATAVAGGAVVIWQIKKDNDTSKAISELTKAQNDAQQQATEETTKKEGALEGTKLADFNPIEKVDSLQSIDLQEGTGEVVKPGATVTAHYTGALAKTGVIFQSSHDMGDAIEFPLSGVIKGWTDGVPGMKVGGKRRLIIPAAQAYGATERPGIPANSDLVFDIEMVSVKQ